MKKTLLTALSVAVLTVVPVITAGAATTATSTNSTQSDLNYSGGGPARSGPLNGPDYYQSSDNPFHSN